MRAKSGHVDVSASIKHRAAGCALAPAKTRKKREPLMLLPVHTYILAFPDSRVHEAIGQHYNISHVRAPLSAGGVYRLETCGEAGDKKAHAPQKGALKQLRIVVC